MFEETFPYFKNTPLIYVLILKYIANLSLLKRT